MNRNIFNLLKIIAATCITTVLTTCFLFGLRPDDAKVETYTLPKHGTPAQQFINENAILLFPASLRQADLLIIVFSAPNNFYLRQAIRRTWGSHTQLHNKTLDLRFLLGETNETDTQRGVNEEHSRYDDIIQVQFVDIVNNTSIKSLMMLKVVYLYYQGRFQFLLKTIDNVYVNLDPIIGLLPNNPSNFLVGNLQVDELAVKWNAGGVKYKASKKKNTYFPTYLLSSMWVMSMDVAVVLFEIALKSNYFEQEDVYITGLLATDGCIRRSDHEMFTYVERKFDPCVLARIVVSHNLTDKEILMLHRKMLNTNQNKCSDMICSGKIPESKQYFRDDGIICVNPADLKVLIHPDNFCSTSVNVVILITSAPENYARRGVIRETWGNLEGADNSKVERYFFIGSPTTNNSNNIQDYIISESIMFQDIVQVNFQDTYQNLTLKSILLLKIATTYCNASTYVMKVDDDSYVNVNLLVKSLNKTKQHDVLVGSLLTQRMRINNIAHKWYVPKSIYKEKRYPQYLSGGGYLMSMDVAARLYNLSYTHLTYVMEDVFITGMLAKIAGIKPKSMQKVSNSNEKNPSAHACSDALSILSHPVKVRDMYVLNKAAKSAETTNCKPGKKH